MPTYDYVCDTCKHTFEQSVSLDLRDSILCIYCGDAEVRRIYSATPIHFKGSGFYATDK